jgi:4-diphosphocytidyl-2-C-methyl-D-erythritol kinase
MIVETAPAKLNLYLHVGPVREDGLHELASIFVFVDEGDRISVKPSNELSLSIEGPFSSALSGISPEQNLVWRAAEKLRRQANVTEGAEITLEKILPIASGIGGGSADAAATLRALVRLWKVDIPEKELEQLAFSLGADVPPCLSRKPVLVTGAGEILTPAPALPPLSVCLVNPGVEMPTGQVFHGFDAANPLPCSPELQALDASSYNDLAASLALTKNDLEPIAIALAPVIGEIIEKLAATPGVLLARMSGSGATVFGLFPTPEAAKKAETSAKVQGWWALSSRLCEG